MIGRMYNVSIGSQAQTTAKTLLEIACPSDAVTIIERLWIKQTSFDTGENNGILLQRITTTGTGTATVPEPLSVGDPAFGGVCKTNMTVEPTYTASTEIIDDGYNVLSGWQWMPASADELITISPSALVGLKLSTAPSASMNFSYGATIREIGG